MSATRRRHRRRGAALIALQAPINSGLGKAVGTFAAAVVSFAIGRSCWSRSRS